MTYYHLTEKSTNVKTGPIPVITSSAATCPSTCPFKNNGCYAEGGPLRHHWDLVTKGERGYTFSTLLSKIKELEEKLISKNKDLKMRLWQAGDMPGVGNRINKKQTERLIKTLTNFSEVFGYTHKPMTDKNIELIKMCNDNNITINLSANSLSHADELLDYSVGPVSTTLPYDINSKKIFTPNGNRVMICPAVLSEKTTCNSCGGSGKSLCSRPDRKIIIGFPAHGFRKKNVTRIINEN